MATNGSSMNEELDSRLDELFDDVKPEKTVKKTDPLENLQAVVLEMEWEIGDKNLDTYLLELKRAGERFKEDKPILVYIKLMDTMGRYLKAKKVAAHPETVSFLKACYDSFEVAVGAGVPASEKNRMAAVQVGEFKRFKAAVSIHSLGKSSDPDVSPAAPALARAPRRSRNS